MSWGCGRRYPSAAARQARSEAEEKQVIEQRAVSEAQGAHSRRQQADVFISLHADSAQSAKARGISVFTLSDTASDKEAAALARKENKADLIGGPELGVEDPEAAGELLRMFQRESMNQSSHLAAAILKQIRDMPGSDRRGHRFAGFAVLKAPDMPSVLIEMGF